MRSASADVLDKIMANTTVFCAVYLGMIAECERRRFDEIMANTTVFCAVYLEYILDMIAQCERRRFR